MTSGRHIIADTILKCLRTGLLLSVIFICGACGQASRGDIEKHLRELSEAGDFITAEYSVSKIIKADDVVSWKIGDRKILLKCKAYLQAGLDMSGYNPAKTVIDKSGKSIVMVLPPPKLISVNIPAEEISLEYSHVTGLRFDFSAEEINGLLRQGERTIKADIAGMGILEDARNNARDYFQSLLEGLGFETIEILFDVV